ncbi:MAG TPA: FG-GAP repeat protein [Rhodanobacteraceae bacterium]|nr:FG-GAP repeat protein [Rhodanobacteraceae bacterium]
MDIAIPLIPRTLRGTLVITAFCALSMSVQTLAAAHVPAPQRIGARPSADTAASVFRPLDWLEQKLSASDGGADDSYSYAVAVSGTTAVVGAPYSAVGGNAEQGAVYVYTESDGVWSQVQKLVATDGAASDGFGFSVSLSGDAILVGAPYATVAGNGGQGAAYVFTGSGGNWTQTQKLATDVGESNNNFGWSVSISGATALISSPVAAVGDNILQGKAYIFTETNDVWTQGPTLTADDGTEFSTFGSSVSLDGTTAVIGAAGVNSYFGAAYVFDGSGGSWIQTGELVPDDGTTLEFFGISVSVSGPTALVGAYYQNVDGIDHQGAAYVFTDSGGTWSQAQKLTPSDGAAGARFGLAVALDGPTALIGSYFADIGANPDQGAAYVFTEADGIWSEADKLVASDGSAGDNFGNAVALSGNTALSGAFNATIDGHAGQGAAYIYTQTAGDTIFEDGFDGVP